MLDPEVETRPWQEQTAVDAAGFGQQLDFLLDASPLYREKITTRVPLERIAELPLTDKPELRASVTPEPVRAGASS